MKLKVVHIHTDAKFIFDTNKYKGEYFENIIIFITNKNTMPKKQCGDILYFKHSKKDFKRILDVCIKADIVVLNDLTPYKTKIVLALPQKIKIAWRFFGYELYTRIIEDFLSEKSKKIREIDFERRNTIENYLKVIKSALWRRVLGIPNFFEAIKRIDYFLGVSKEEYDLLKSYWPTIPRFIKFPINQDPMLFKTNYSIKETIIILGNNRSIYNNHIDLIDIVKAAKPTKNYQFKILFNYGTETTYTDQIRKEVSGQTNIELVEDFMTKEEFDFFYKKASTFVHNGYRQMALGNIFAALRNGVKVYLNEKNVIMQWLLNEDFLIFSLNDFPNDIECDNLRLTQREAQTNIDQLSQLMKNHTVEHFQQNIIQLFEEKKTII